MIKSNELRIGNLVYFTGNGNNNPCPILELWKKECLVEYVGNSMGIFYDSDEVHSIPLSAEILEKAGFKKDWNGYSLQNIRSVSFAITKDGELLACWLYRSLGFTVNYLHQLQNLYFALTGEELPLEL